MSLVIVYVHVNGWFDPAMRFLNSYHNHPPGVEHESIVVCNGSKPDDEIRFLFASLPNLTILEHDNTGQDIGAFQMAAEMVPADMMMFFGAHTYFRRRGWLWRAEEAFRIHGNDNLYGATGNQGIASHGVWPHIRTTAFWCSPSLMNQFPWRIVSSNPPPAPRGIRYEFEHGAHGLTTWVTQVLRRRAIVVGWNGEVDVAAADSLPSGFHQGDQRNVLVGDRMTAPPYYTCE